MNVDGHTHDHTGSAAVSSRVKAIVSRLEADGITTERELDEIVEQFLLRARAENGYGIVARAWIDAGFKERLLSNANVAIAELGIDLTHWAPVKLRVVENTPDAHNIITCTLCSCYPIALLGPSPQWYKSEAYRSRVVREPREILSDFGVSLPDTVAVNVWDSTAEVRYMVLPVRPRDTESLNETQLAQLVTRNGLIGTALV